MSVAEALFWLGLALSAFTTGLGKGGVPGIANLSPIVLASVLPARESVGVLLPVLIACDVLAVVLYRRHASGGLLLRLLPWTLPGIALGTAYLAWGSDGAVRALIGAVMLGITLFHWLRQLALQKAPAQEPRATDRPPPPTPWWQAWVAPLTGTLAGFASMVANAAGPVAAVYLLAQGLPKLAFIGTTAWFFLVLNLLKLGPSVAAGVVGWSSLAYVAVMLPVAYGGVLLAPQFVHRLPQKTFETLIWVFVVLGCILLLLPR